MQKDKSKQPWKWLCGWMTALQDENFYQSRSQQFIRSYWYDGRWWKLGVSTYQKFALMCRNVNLLTTSEIKQNWLTSHLLSWICLFNRMVQFSAATSAQCAMVMAMGQDRSRPGGPYVTAGLIKISDPSSDTALFHKMETLINFYVC